VKGGTVSSRHHHRTSVYHLDRSAAAILLNDRRLVRVESEGGQKMSEAQTWNVHYFQHGDPQQERTRLLSSMHNALTAACALCQRHAVQYVAGPKGEKFDSDAIMKWCAENVK
jgi:hypothetical protein